jgi:UDP-glucuronate 4-epimerase
VEGISCVINSNPPQQNIKWTGIHPDPGSSKAPYVVLNIGNSKPVRLMDFISAIEKTLGKKAVIEKKPMQPGDVVKTFADISSISGIFTYKPKISFEEGIRNFIEWYKSYNPNKP